MTPQGRRLVRRLSQLYAGLVLFGVSIAVLLRANLGLDSWDVLHQGIALRTGLPFGLVVNVAGALVLFAWIPLKVRPGIGTISNVLVVGVVADLTTRFLATPDNLALRYALLAAGIGLNAMATGAYIGARLGPGPRDGLMLGLAARGYSVRMARTCIELTVLVTGWLLGGSVGVGTLAYALAIGPAAQPMIKLFAVRLPSANAELDSLGDHDVG